MQINYQILGTKIKSLRKKKKLSQQTLSELIDISPTYMSYIESGLRSMSLETLVALANTLDVTTDTLLSESLKHNTRAYTNEITEVISDCNEYERRILFENLKATKKVLKDNRYLIQRFHRKQYTLNPNGLQSTMSGVHHSGLMRTQALQNEKKNNENAFREYVF